MSDISAVSPGTHPFASTPPTRQAPAPAPNELGADTFLQLLVAQLKYQDPTSPAEGTEFLAQTAQFTMVEKLTEIAEQTRASELVSRNLAAASMVGQTIGWLADDGTAGEGTVTRARLTADGPLLTVGELEVPLERVTAIGGDPA